MAANCEETEELARTFEINCRPAGMQSELFQSFLNANPFNKSCPLNVDEPSLDDKV